MEINKHIVTLRSRTALKQITCSDERKEASLARFLANPIDKEMMVFFSEQKDPYNLRKRIIQEQSAHFILRHLVRNNLLLGESSILKVMGLAGPNPMLAVASYMRRGLITEAHLFEKDRYIHSMYTEESKTPEYRERICRFAHLFNTNYWTKNKQPKKMKVACRDYLTDETKVSFQGFLLDHCGKMPEPEVLVEYIKKKASRGAFFVEATMIDGRVTSPKAWSGEFEDLLYNEGIYLLAKDSFEYKGGLPSNKYSSKGSPMKTFVWILDRGPESRLSMQ